MDQCGSGKREKTSILRVGGVVGVEVQVDHEYMETWVKSNICERRRQVPKGVCKSLLHTEKARSELYEVLQIMWLHTVPRS